MRLPGRQYYRMRIQKRGMEVDDRQFTMRIEQCDRKLYRVAMSILRSEADAADAIQEAVFKAWLRRGTLRVEERFAAWLTRILVNECRNIQRKGDRRGEVERQIEPMNVPPPDPQLHLAVMSLRENLRLPLVLHHLEGYSLQEISEILDISQTTVKSRLHQARAALRRALEENHE